MATSPRQSSVLATVAMLVIVMAAGSLVPRSDNEVRERRSSSQAPRPTAWVEGFALEAHNDDRASSRAPTAALQSSAPPSTEPLPDVAVDEALQGSTEDATVKPTPAGAVVVAPEGDPRGAGRYEDPLDLASALRDDGAVRPGGAVLLRGGRYAGTFTSELSGRRTNPIVVRSYPGEWAVLDGGSIHAATLTVRGRHTVVQDLEITRSDPQRRTVNAGSDPADLSRADGTGVDVFGVSIRLSGLVVHDNGNGIGLWGPAADAEIVGCLIFNNGWVGPDRGHGHGIYVQNRTGTKRIADSVVFNNFGYGIHAYGFTNGIRIEGTTSFGNGTPAGARYPNVFVGSVEDSADRISLQDNVLFHDSSTHGTNLQLGYAGVRNQRLEVIGNRVLGGQPSVSIEHWRELAFRGNDLWAIHEPHHTLVDLNATEPSASPLAPESDALEWDQNSYAQESKGGAAPASFRFNADSADDALTFPEWQQEAGLDAGSDYSTRSREGQDVIVRGAGSGPTFLVVLNFDEARTVQFDPRAAGIRSPRRIEVRDVEDVSGLALETDWTGGPIEIALDGADVMQPIGSGAHVVRHTPATFGVFLLTAR